MEYGSSFPYFHKPKNDDVTGLQKSHFCESFNDKLDKSADLHELCLEIKQDFSRPFYHRCDTATADGLYSLI